MKAEYRAEPFRHWVIEDLIDPLRRKAAFYGLPKRDWSGWVRYDSDCERAKRTCTFLDLQLPGCLGYPPQAVLAELEAPALVGALAQLAGVEGLQTDSLRWGAGIHVTDPGGHLNCHLDYALHESGLERRINLIVFLVPEWREEWGGAFELYDQAGRAVAERIYPAPGRAVVWEAGDLAYHGTQRVHPGCPLPRITAATYYLAPPRPGCVRRRALFVPSR